MEAFILMSTLPYEGVWIKGVVQTLEEASQYFSDEIDDEYFSYFAEKWQGTQKICTYEYDTKTKMLVKQRLQFGEKGNDSDNEGESNPKSEDE